MKPHHRRILQAILYEAIALALVSPTLALVSGKSGGTALGVSVVMTLIALGWNYVFNTLFERWERRQPQRGRTLARRMLHSAGFEGGLTILLVPVMVGLLDLTWLDALLADVALSVFFLGYSFVFTWLFDKVFGLPESARPQAPDPA